MSHYETNLDKNNANFVPLTPLSFLLRAKDIYPNYEAIVYENRKYTWSEVYKRCVKFASALSKIGISKGDTVNFVATDMSHNSASLDGMIPAGADSWNGALSQDISITFTEEGVYVYQCTPHAMMAMVGVIQVGDAVNLDAVKAEASQKKSIFVSNTDRLDEYLSQL